MAIYTEVVPKSMKFTPTDDKGGTLTWKERVSRPGFRPVVKERSIRKDYHLADTSEKISDPEIREMADQCSGATP
jgi:hypothetical protein